MLKINRFAVLAVLVFVPVVLVMGQSSGNRNQNSNDEMSVEESYLQESVELMVIREAAQGGSREQKLIALEYLENAISRGNTGEEVRQALEYLALEGVVNKARENGRLVNNFPDVRTRAATYLGELGTPEAKNTLIKMVVTDPEPMVLVEAIKSLGKIGNNDNEETVNAIAWTFTRFDVLNPDNLLALSTVDAIAKLAEENGGIKDPTAIRALIRIADGGHYIRPVQEKARAVLADLRKYNAKSQREQQNK
jgi:HEAT repeat protein